MTTVSVTVATMLTLTVPIHFQTQAAHDAFVEALTGDDRDVLLAAERAINTHLGVSGYENGAWVAAPLKT